jgi:hypothetical protein
MKTAVIGRYGIMEQKPSDVWITVLEGENAGEGAGFSRAALNAALFPGGGDLFAVYAERGHDDCLALHGAVDRFYRENF